MHGVQDFLEAFKSAYSVEGEVLRLGEFVLGGEAFKEGGGVPVDVFHEAMYDERCTMYNYVLSRSVSLISSKVGSMMSASSNSMSSISIDSARYFSMRSVIFLSMFGIGLIPK